MGYDVTPGLRVDKIFIHVRLNTEIERMNKCVAIELEAEDSIQPWEKTTSRTIGSHTTEQLPNAS